MKKTVFAIIGTILLLSLCLCSCSSNSTNADVGICTADFKAINDVLSDIETREDELYSVIHNEEGNFEIYDFPVELNENQLYSLNQISNAFSTDFSFIKITENRITYGGNGTDMFVYSKDGKKPEYFYYKGDKIRFSVQKLGDNWYYCDAWIR